jgi:hypothetical protein
MEIFNRFMKYYKGHKFDCMVRFTLIICYFPVVALGGWMLAKCVHFIKEGDWCMVLTCVVLSILCFCRAYKLTPTRPIDDVVEDLGLEDLKDDIQE